jgi:epoxyqueuosine reductase
VARYAWGLDYHYVLRTRLDALRAAIIAEFGEFEYRTFVDTGRLVDRAAAVRAGLGWYGKNTNVLNSRLGSWLFLGSLVTTLELEPDQPTRQHCGGCHACIDVCPTGAITAPYVVDNNRCISFLTIELRGPIPRDLRPLIGGYVFGCDLCQDVCPVNRQAQPAYHADFAAVAATPTAEQLPELLALSDDGFLERFRHSPIRRAKRRGLLRNVAVALGNTGGYEALQPLADCLAQEREPLVRGHAAWALGRLGGREPLRRAQGTETDPYVLEEIEVALTAQ